MNSNKVILITGSSKGIGAHLAQHFSNEDYIVIINYNKSENAALALVKSIKHKYNTNKLMTIRADVSKRSEVKKMFDEAHNKFGNIDVLINCAGINRDAPFLEMIDDQWDSVVNTVLKGTFMCSQEFALRYKGENGHIINIGSLSAVRGRKNGVNYASARAGVLNLSRCLALELAPRICVNSVSLGYINTDEVMSRYKLHNEENLKKALSEVSLGRLGTPEDVFKMMKFIIEESSYVTGHNFCVDGGFLMR